MKETLMWRQRKIPKRHHDKTFDNFKDHPKEKYIDHLKQYISNYPSQPIEVMMFGETGCGKTHLACATYLELTNQEKLTSDQFQFITTPEFLFQIRKTFNNNPIEHESDVIERYSDCDFLVLDDLGSESDSDFSVRSLYILIDRRMRNLKSTFITSNLSLKEIEEKLDARIASRLASMKVMKINLKDYRKKR